MFNINVQQTLQLVLPKLAIVESEQTLHCLRTSSRHNMVQVDAHTYILVSPKLLVATLDQKDLLNTEGPIEVVLRLYMQGHLYTSGSYFRGLQGKRNNTVCFKTCAAMAKLIRL